jgi:predicted acetyltransferase
MNVEIKQIIGIDEEILKITTDWMYKWWGIEENYRYEEVRCYMKHSFNDKKLPQTYGIFLDNKIIGMYQFTYRDLFLRPDIYPWLANVHIDEKYRNNGFGKKLIESVKNNAVKNLEHDEIYLYTQHENLYEKYGWERIGKENILDINFKSQILYKLKIR